MMDHIEITFVGLNPIFPNITREIFPILFYQKLQT